MVKFREHLQKLSQIFLEHPVCHFISFHFEGSSRFITVALNPP